MMYKNTSFARDYIPVAIITYRTWFFFLSVRSEIFFFTRQKSVSNWWAFGHYTTIGIKRSLTSSGQQNDVYIYIHLHLDVYLLFTSKKLKENALNNFNFQKSFPSVHDQLHWTQYLPDVKCYKLSRDHVSVSLNNWS